MEKAHILKELDRLYRRAEKGLLRFYDGDTDEQELIKILEYSQEMLGYLLHFNNATLEEIEEKTLVTGPVYRDVWYVLDSFVNYRQSIPWTDTQVKEHIDSLCDQLMENSLNA